MNYKELLETASGRVQTEASADGINEAIQKLLSPRPLDKPEDLEQIISTRFRYTGPGKWMKVLRETAEK